MLEDYEEYMCAATDLFITVNAPTISEVGGMITSTYETRTREVEVPVVDEETNEPAVDEEGNALTTTVYGASRRNVMG